MNIIIEQINENNSVMYWISINFLKFFDNIKRMKKKLIWKPKKKFSLLEECTE